MAFTSLDATFQVNDQLYTLVAFARALFVPFSTLC